MPGAATQREPATGARLHVPRMSGLDDVAADVAARRAFRRAGLPGRASGHDAAAAASAATPRRGVMMSSTMPYA